MELEVRFSVSDGSHEANANESQRELGANHNRPVSRWQENLRAAIAETAIRVSGAVASAQELLRDRDLRRKGAAFIVNRAQEGLHAIGKQISQGVGGFVNKQQLAALLSRLENQINEYQRDKHLREHRRQTVDVQVGPDLYCNVPQEIRCRLWIALLEDPTLAEPFRPIQCRQQAKSSSLNPLGLEDAVLLPTVQPVGLPEGVSSEALGANHVETSASRIDAEGPLHRLISKRSNSTPAGLDLLSGPSLDPFAASETVICLPSPALELSAASFDPFSQLDTQTQEHQLPDNSGVRHGCEAPPSADAATSEGWTWPSAASNISASGLNSSSIDAVRSFPLTTYNEAPASNGDFLGWSGACQHVPDLMDNVQIAEPEKCVLGLGGQYEFGHADPRVKAVGEAREVEGRLNLSEEDGQPSEEARKAVLSEGGTIPWSQEHRYDLEGQSSLERGRSKGSKESQVQTTKEFEEGSRGSTDVEKYEESGFEGWEMLPEGTAYGTGSGSNSGPSLVQSFLLRILSGSEACSSASHSLPGVIGRPLSVEELGARARLVQALLDAPWSQTEGVPAEYSDDSRFAILNDMTAGQEEIDDIIKRDMHRTFPEHPFFTSEAGQRALFRVLKAYSLHDLEVGYCQGMAFVAGILLMYLPEEPAFRLFCRLMDPEGPNLRRMYMPSLDALKHELARFEVLLSQLHPRLYRHITDFGVPSVLYASQWLMTVFSTAFPSHFSARVIDVMLQDGNDCLMMRISLAIMSELEESLLEQQDFELLVTQLKVTPAKWGLTKLRKIMDNAMSSSISDAQLDVAGVVAAQELALSPKPTRSHSNKNSSHRNKLSRGSTAENVPPAGLGSGIESATMAGLAPEVGDRQVSSVGDGTEPDLIDLGFEASASHTGFPQNKRDYFGYGDEDDLLGLGEEDLLGGSFSGLEIDDEYMKMIMELDLLTPSEKDNLAGDR
ncbi:hypothetical protein CEUSTIGMA_g11652.t1 [Chlamydomonas eustigma]|uniref:Rab-GAP TBC domain-containing protein n=1 Tax=Chlamydomonas eustigma TaxID=1157962 RepID=A0A250XMR8_9CHLO|nr:hypothetical protein CEUSTIGMA_g11652.t1 [Chlamydomonas eustigma]|eukprot:GAX84229.1 hypothetical protein CEUSTIGMA_g11652.t1 [Chlamydomonas eustigma]